MKKDHTPILEGLQPSEINSLRKDAHAWQAVYYVLRHRKVIDKIPLSRADFEVWRFTGKLIWTWVLSDALRRQNIAEQIVVAIRIEDAGK